MYFAVANVNGPISVAMEATSFNEALAEFESLDLQGVLDDARTDAEDALDICGDGMTESEFDAALASAGCVPRRDLSLIINAHSGTTAHLEGGWYLWESPAW